MQKTWLKNYVIAGIAVAVIAVATPLIVNAESGRTTTVRPTRTQEVETTRTTEVENEPTTEVETEPARDSQINEQERKGEFSDRREAAETKLTAAKLSVCQKHEEVIGNIIARMSDRGTKQFGVFTKIADRTEAFYVKSGKVLANHDALVADVNAKKAEAQAAMPTTTVMFECDGTDPKGVASSFKTSRTTLNTALKAYKTAVKNLIVGVKSVQDTTPDTEGSKQ